MAGKEKSSGEKARDTAETVFKLRSIAEEHPLRDQFSTGCRVCSVYEALAKRGWLKKKSEGEYRDHLVAKHGLEV